MSELAIAESQAAHKHPPLRRTAANLLSVVGGEGLLRIANFAATVVIARLYGPVAMGVYTAALAIATVMVTVGDNGLQIAAVSEISGRPDHSHSIVSVLYFTKTLLFAFMLGIAFLIATSIGLDRDAWMIGLLVTLKTITYSYGQLQFGVMKALDRMKWIGGVQSIHFIVLLFGILVVYYVKPSLAALLVFMLACQILEESLGMIVLWNAGIRPVRARLSDCWAILHSSTPIGVSYVLAAAIVRMDVIIASLLFVPAAIGQFAAANNGLVVVYAASWIFGSVLLPDFVRCSDKLAVLQAHANQWIWRVAVTTLPASIAVALCARWMIRVLYGPAFVEAGLLASVMVLAMPLILVNAILFNQAVALNIRRLFLGTYALTAIAGIGLNLFMGKTFGPLGICGAILAREIVMLLLFTRGIRANLGASAGPLVNKSTSVRTDLAS
jgi:O-antigen/teichoic acid export membrane protein